MNELYNALTQFLNENGYKARLSDLGGEIIILPPRNSPRQPALGISLNGTNATLHYSYNRDSHKALTVDLAHPQSIEQLLQAAQALL